MNFHRYITSGQKVSLINTSPDREEDVFESLTAYVNSCGPDYLDLTLPYRSKNTDPYKFLAGMRFKLASESLGVGFQISLAYDSSVDSNVVRFRPQGNMEIFQRRQSYRTDCVLEIYYLRKDLSIETFRKEWKRISAYVQKAGMPPDLVPVFHDMNLSSGGFRITLEEDVPPLSLALVFILLEDGRPPVCAVAELVWSRPDDSGSGFPTGHRFISILKSDQKRLDDFVASELEKQGQKVDRHKSNWALTEKMVFEGKGR